MLYRHHSERHRLGCRDPAPERLCDSLDRQEPQHANLRDKRGRPVRPLAERLGFDYFYGFMAGDTNQVRPYLFENQTPIGTPDGDDYYLSTDLADQTINWLKTLEAIQPGKPWFAYLAPAATHAPHQAPKELIDTFKGKFDMGWDAYREQTFQRQKDMGIIPENTELTSRPGSLPAWDSLNDDQKKLYTRMMESLPPTASRSTRKSGGYSTMWPHCRMPKHDDHLHRRR